MYSDMRMFEGHFKDDQRVGYGKLFNADGSIEFEGEWRDDLPVRVFEGLSSFLK